jgi:hypothetical protein
MVHKSIIAALLVSLLGGSLAQAEKVDLDRAELHKTATHVVTGQVLGIYERQETRGDWQYKRYVAEVRVDKCEKGEGLDSGDLVYVRYWHRQWIGAGQVPPSTSGHRGLPSSGDKLRVYLARNAYDGFSPENHDGGYNVIGANGFEKLAESSGK